jgi:hypothetical protein
MELDHLSYSSISMFLACGEAWKRKYLLNEPTYATPELAFGTAVHGTVEKHIGEGASLLDTWGAEWHKATEGKEIMWGADTPEQHYNEGLRILGNEQVALSLASIRPLKDGQAIERKVALNVPGVPIPVIGFIDLIAEDGVPGDIKTSAKSWSQERAQGELQSLFYLAALNQAGQPTPGWKFRHYTIVKTKTPKFEMFEHLHSAGELMFLFDLIQLVWGAISAGMFTLNPGSWKCSPNFCDFFSKCRGKYAR